MIPLAEPVGDVVYNILLELFTFVVLVQYNTVSCTWSYCSAIYVPTSPNATPITMRNNDM